MSTVIASDALENEGTFEGYLHEDAGASFILVNAAPEDGPALPTPLCRGLRGAGGPGAVHGRRPDHRT